METKIEYATLTIYLSNRSDMTVRNVRFDTVELTNTSLTFKDLDHVWYAIPIDSLMYFTYVITD